MQESKSLAIFLATSGHSGVDRVMKNLIPAFAAKGVRVDLLHIDNHGPHLDYIPDNVRVVNLGVAHTLPAISPLIRYLRKERPQAILSDKDRVNRVSLLAARLSRVPTRISVRMGTTVSVNVNQRDRLSRCMHYLSMHYLYSWADSIIVPSGGVADDLSQFAGIPRDLIHVIPNPIVTPLLYEQAAQEPKHPWFENRKGPVILGVGELCKRKDFATLIRAFALVKEKLHCKLLILGEGRKRAALEELAQNLRLGDDFSMPGFVENPYGYMRRASLFVLTSAWEGSPVVLTEALALGMPVVSTDCPSGPREILANGLYGSLVPVGDPRALARAMLATLEKPPEKTKSMEAAGDYNVENSSRQYLNILFGEPVKPKPD
ncbi:MAG: glycosyltransferase [Desulfobacterales bacterium]|nr:glycosyltransferase [Desulfobacterales bacterium]